MTTPSIFLLLLLGVVSIWQQRRIIYRAPGMRRSFERFLLDKKPTSWQLDLHMLLAQTAGTLTIMVMRIISKNNNTLPCFDKVDKVICAALSLINCIQPLIISRTPHPRCKLCRCGPCFVFFSRFASLCFALFSSTLICFVEFCFILLATTGCSDLGASLPCSACRSSQRRSCTLCSSYILEFWIFWSFWIFWIF